MNLRIALFILLAPVLANAQQSSYEISGYLKYLSSSSTYPSIDGRLYDQLLHARLNTSWYPTESIRGELDMRARAYYGQSVEKIPHFSDLIKTRYDFASLDAVLWSARRSVAYAQIDRVWLDYSAGKLEATLGRQRIAWGTALVWNVIDLYNPKSVLDFDYEEKPGADALRLQYYTGAVSKVEFAAQPAKSAKKAIVAGLYSINAFEYDFYGIAGVRDNRWVAGGAWAGSILKGGFRGEFLFSGAPDKSVRPVAPPPAIFGNSLTGYDKPVFSMVLSGDYTLPNSFYIHTECLYNSIGRTSNAGLFQQDALDAGMLSPARWSLYQEFAYNVTPLMRATLFGIWNPNDKSGIVVPMVTRSLKTNLDLLVIALLGSGKQYSEYGDAGKSVYLRLKYSY
jgi:hypothetical protein